MWILFQVMLLILNLKEFQSWYSDHETISQTKLKMKCKWDPPMLISYCFPSVFHHFPPENSKHVFKKNLSNLISTRLYIYIYIFFLISKSLLLCFDHDSVSSFQSWELETFTNKNWGSWHYLFTSRVDFLRKTPGLMTLSLKLQPLPAKQNINVDVHIPLVLTLCINTEIPLRELCSWATLKKSWCCNVPMISQSAPSLLPTT